MGAVYFIHASNANSTSPVTCIYMYIIIIPDEILSLSITVNTINMCNTIDYFSLRVPIFTFSHTTCHCRQITPASSNYVMHTGTFSYTRVALFKALLVN